MKILLMGTDDKNSKWRDRIKEHIACDYFDVYDDLGGGLPWKIEHMNDVSDELFTHTLFVITPYMFINNEFETYKKYIETNKCKNVIISILNYDPIDVLTDNDAPSYTHEDTIKLHKLEYVCKDKQNVHFLNDLEWVVEYIHDEYVNGNKTLRQAQVA